MAVPNPSGVLLPAKNCEDAQNFDVEPDDGDHDSKGCLQAKHSGSTALDTRLDAFKIHHQRVGRQQKDEDSEDGAQRNTEDFLAAKPEHAPGGGVITPG